MRKRVLIGCYEIPGYGGVSTASYQLFEYLQRDGLEVCYLNIIDGGDEEYYTYMFSENYMHWRQSEKGSMAVGGGWMIRPTANPEISFPNLELWLNPE